MKNLKTPILLLAITLTVACLPAFAQKHEIGLTLGRLIAKERSTPGGGTLRLESGVALQANYGYRFLKTPHIALLAEVHLLASPLRDVTSSIRTLTRDFATLYVTPGLRVKFAPDRKFSPYVAVGGGYSQYEQSDFQIDGRPNPAPKRVHHGAFDFGGGLDVKVWRFLGIRGEVRDFYTGSPSLNSLVSGNGQHNVVAGGGFVLAFGR